MISTNLGQGPPAMLPLVCCAALMGLGQVFFKILAQGQPPSSSPIEWIWHLLGRPQLYFAAIIYAIAALMWILALKRLQLSSAYPVMIGLSILTVRMCGWAVWAEKLGKTDLFGTILLLAGVVLINAPTRLLIR